MQKHPLQRLHTEPAGNAAPAADNSGDTGSAETPPAPEDPEPGSGAVNTSTGTAETPGEQTSPGGTPVTTGESQEPRAVPPAPASAGVAASVPDGAPAPRTADDRPVEDKQAHLRSGGPGRTAPGEPG